MKALDFEMNEDFEEAYAPRKKGEKNQKVKRRHSFDDEESPERGRKKHKIDKKNAPRASWKQ